MSEPAQAIARVEPRLELLALPGVPIVQPGDSVGDLAADALERAGLEVQSGRAVLVITSKLLSRAEGRFVDLATVVPSERAQELAQRTGKDARSVELILRESIAVSRVAKQVLIVRHRLGFVSANAGIDESNAKPAHAAEGSGPWALLMPTDPDGAARAIRERVRARVGADLGVVITDSHGRPFRLGTVGATLGLSGLPALHDQRGGHDLFGRRLENTITALADQIAAAADLVAGQAAEARPIVLVRGLWFAIDDASCASQLLRPAEQDLYV